jgi:hypothetical protein
MILGFSLRDVVAQSDNISRRRGDSCFALSLGALYTMETKGTPPTIHRLATLAHIYGKPVAELLSLYGIS